MPNAMRRFLEPKSSTLRLAALIAIGYFVSAQVGFALRFPPATTSVLWPPNAMLTAALLLTPARLWPVCLGAALPAHLLAELGAGWPPALVAGLFITNCTEALIAATLVRWLSDASARLDTLRRVVVFITAAVCAPFVSSFFDAALVYTLRGESYWDVWRTRTFANTLTQFSVVPVIVTLAAWSWSEFIGRAKARAAEALLLTGSVVLAGVFITGLGRISVPSVVRTPTAFLLPLFFWAAVRFGPAGVSATLLLFAAVASQAAVNGARPYGSLSPADSLVAVQLFLCAITIPVMCVSALLDERRHSLATLAKRLSFEELFSRTSAAFVQVPSDRMGSAFAACLSRVGEFFSADRALLMQRRGNEGSVVITEQWTAPGIAPLPDLHFCDAVPWTAGECLAGNDVNLSTPEMPEPLIDGAVNNRELGGALLLPLIVSANVHGMLCIQSTRPRRVWTPVEVTQLRVIAEVLASALARKHSEDALRSSESMKSAILASLSSQVAVLDRHGTVITVNEVWLRAADNARVPHDARVRPGDNYCDVLRLAAAEGDSRSIVALAGLEDVLNGRRASFVSEYARRGEHTRWYAMTVVPLQREERGAVVSHEDVTERKHAEVEAQRMREEFDHLTRVSTLGELMSSLAHQLNQPLTSILTNAQVARRLLQTSLPDLGEIRDIVGDIIDDDQRAGAVIRRMRDITVRSDADPTVLEVNALIRDVAMLITSDTIIRNISVTFDLTPDPSRVRGKRAELQQAFLNVVLNAMDAVDDCPIAERRVDVRTAATAHGEVRVSVEDSGSGVPPNAEDHIFEPFFTTKRTGIGIGLAIARSTIEAHGGRIWAENGARGGAAFYISLPQAEYSA